MTEKLSKPKILIVEDEEAIRRGLCDLVAFRGWEPVAASDGQEGLEKGQHGDCQLALLDVMMPEIDGFSLCRMLREKLPSLGIIMLTAKGSEEDILTGFQAGADDYISKPFSVAQLSVRIEALLRRTKTEALEADEALQLGPISCSLEELICHEGDASAGITRLDYLILQLLAEEPGRIISRRNLLSTVWEYPNPDMIETRCVDMQIAKLRKKLQPLPTGTHLIETVRGEGYRLGISL